MENQKEMVEFIKWIATNPEEIVAVINGMTRSEEGKKSLQELFTKFKASKQNTGKFKNGGRINKFQPGGYFGYRSTMHQPVYEGFRMTPTETETYRQDDSGYYNRFVNTSGDTIFTYRPNYGELYTINSHSGNRRGAYSNIRGNKLNLSAEQLASIIDRVNNMIEGEAVRSERMFGWPNLSNLPSRSFKK